MRISFLSATAVVLSLAAAGVSGRTASGDIVLHAADVSVLSGAWSKVASSAAAGGVMLSTPDAGWATTSMPVASPQHYFEATFDADASTTYQLWMRMRGAADSKWNESVWVQFDNAVATDGTPRWRIGSLSALLVNLENCSGCGIANWGWQDNAYWLSQPARVRFATSGPQTLRVQVREDGVAIDQIVLSPSTWLTTSPGALKNDATIVPKPSVAPTVTLVRHPYVQQVSDRRAVVVWATRENGIANVRYAVQGVAKVAPAQSRLVPATLTGMGFDYYQHEATLTELTPRTGFAYTPSVDGIAVSSGDTFVTAPPVGSGPIRFIAFGDSGVGSIEQRQLATRMTSDRFDFAVHTGDVAYATAAPSGPGGYPQLQSWFFDIYRAWLRTRPIFPSIGNHDNEANFAAPYRDVFVLPTNGGSTTFPDHRERYYSFDYGPAHVVVLDTELAFQDVTRREAQLRWLENDLASTPQPWKIAVFHRSPYSAGGEHGSDIDVRSAFGPVFDRHHVDLALSGHEHDYERSIPIRETADGGPTVYVVTGGGGARLYPAGTAWWTASSNSVFHYVRLIVDGCRMTLAAVGLDAAVFDATAIDKCTTTVPPPPSTAFGGTPAAIPGVIQAEHFDQGSANTAYVDTTAGNSGGSFRTTDVDIQATTDAGGGYNVGWIRPGEWLAYSVDVSQSRLYTVSARVASNGAGGTFHIEVDGVDVTGAITIPNTGGHQTWTTVTKSAGTVSAGAHRVRVVFDAIGPTGAFGNVNYIRFE
jgi:hypothetical protein